MKRALIFFYKKSNRYSYNALIGALEKYPQLSALDIFIPSNEQNLLQILKNISNKYKLIILTISFFTTQVFETIELIKKVKFLNIKNLKLIAGGPHPTGEPERTLKIGFNFVLVGEGEITFPDAIIKIINNESIPQIIYPQNKVDLNDFFPLPRFKIKKFGPIEITRGCPFFCNFCQTSRIFGGKVRHRSIENILDIIKYLKKENRTDIRFITPNAFAYGSKNGREINFKAIEILLKEIKNILKNDGRIFFGSFPSEVRPEHVNEDTVSIIKKYCSNDNIVIGAQSGSEKILKLSNRQHGVKDIFNAVKITKKFGLIPNVDFIFGLPGENENDIIETLKVMRELIKLGARIHAHTFMPLPQTPYKKSPPGKISKLFYNEFKHDIPDGIIFGNYIQQEKLAEKIYNYFNS